MLLHLQTTLVLYIVSMAPVRLNSGDVWMCFSIEGEGEAKCDEDRDAFLDHSLWSNTADCLT